MSLTITLSPDVEAALAERARDQGLTSDQCAADIVSQTVLPTPLGLTPDKPRPKQGTPEWMDEFNAWMADIERRPAITHFVDDSRDSIYGGPDDRGER